MILIKTFRAYLLILRKALGRELDRHERILARVAYHDGWSARRFLQRLEG